MEENEYKLGAMKLFRGLSINIIYVLLWALLAFVSTFVGILDNDWTKFFHGDLLNDIFTPILLWIAGFFGDYLYSIYSYDKTTHTLNLKWTKVSYIVIEIIFVLLLLSIHVTISRTFCVIGLYLSMISLKMASLYVVCPLQKVESI
jgi:hypothetical protein